MITPEEIEEIKVRFEKLGMQSRQGSWEGVDETDVGMLLGRIEELEKALADKTRWGPGNPAPDPHNKKSTRTWNDTTKEWLDKPQNEAKQYNESLDDVVRKLILNEVTSADLLKSNPNKPKEYTCTVSFHAIPLILHYTFDEKTEEAEVQSVNVKEDENILNLFGSRKDMEILDNEATYYHTHKGRNYDQPTNEVDDEEIPV